MLDNTELFKQKRKLVLEEGHSPCILHYLITLSITFHTLPQSRLPLKRNFQNNSDKRYFWPRYKAYQEV